MRRRRSARRSDDEAPSTSPVSQSSECRDKQLRSRFRDLRPRRTVISSARQSPRAHGDLADRTATRVSPPRSPRTRDAHRSTRPPNARCWCARGPSPLEPASRVYHPRPLFRGRKERKRERATRERGRSPSRHVRRASPVPSLLTAPSRVPARAERRHPPPEPARNANLTRAAPHRASHPHSALP